MDEADPQVERVRLRDGSRVAIRPVREADEPELRAFLTRAMLDVFRDGFDARVRLRDGVQTVSFPACAWRRAGARFPVAPG